ncbi:acetyl-CoA synthetase-like protein [Rhodocollybia butyracea]|uniref:Acetyl-CoA synthetase-like protein n=1 Tax=Rhodocollybia butyracea TaxID=206335 RepID=A0A9P5U7U5_9AGAR|nr:acetyl-CoA synthetase-like protein [Rhodocollybia butyracea]
MLRTHLSVLESSAARFSSSPAFRVPILDGQTGKLNDWETISYTQFLFDVERSAVYWSHQLRDIPQRSVIGLWIGGFTYVDVLHIYGLSRAGYVPQMFSLRLSNADVILELLIKANAKATFNCHVPIYQANQVAEVDGSELSSVPLRSLPVVTESDMAFIFHTSGSTSGSPKLVPCSYRWLDTTVSKSGQIGRPRNEARQDVTSWMVPRLMQDLVLIGSLQHGSCTIQPTTISFSTDELMEMVTRCGLNRLNQFAAFLAMKLRDSRSDPKLLSILSNLDEIIYSGMPLARDAQEWALQNGLNVTVSFRSGLVLFKELGATLISVGGSGTDAPLLRSLEGVSYEFVPVDSAPLEGHQSTARLLEFVVRSDSGDCPHSSLRASDGHFHTGDLFQEVLPGRYVPCGRDDDWIKSENSLRCDTKAIEDNVRATCGNLIAECIVVGTGRPSPTLFVEPAVDMDHDKLKKDILRKIRPFHSRLYLHEKISSPKMVVIVSRDALPRTATKGNIRRKAVEDTYRAQLDQIYGATSQ